jgi:hypothetical protein
MLLKWALQFLIDRRGSAEPTYAEEMIEPYGKLFDVDGFASGSTPRLPMTEKGASLNLVPFGFESLRTEMNTP